MNSQRAWEQYTFWFSYHLNHVHFQRTNNARRDPWPHCDECTHALDRTKYADSTGRFGLKSKYTRNSESKQSKVGFILLTFTLLFLSIIPVVRSRRLYWKDYGKIIQNWKLNFS